MSHYRVIDVRIWNDEKFIRLSPEAKLCFLYILTNQYLTPYGAMKMGMEHVLIETGTVPIMVSGTVPLMVSEMIVERLVILSDHPSLIYVPNFLKYNLPHNSNIVKPWRESLDYLPECPLKQQIIEDIVKHLTGMEPQYLLAFNEGKKTSRNRSSNGFGNGSWNDSRKGSENGTTLHRTLNIEHKKKEKVKKESEKNEIVIQEKWDNEEFRSALQRFLEYRKEIKKPLRPTSQAAFLKKYAEYDSSIMVNAIDTSIANGYQGIFPEKVGNNGTPFQKNLRDKFDGTIIERDIGPDFKW